MIIEWQGERLSVEQVRNLPAPSGGEEPHRLPRVAIRGLAADIVAEHPGDDVIHLDDSVTLLGLGSDDSASLRDEIERLREGL